MDATYPDFDANAFLGRTRRDIDPTRPLRVGVIMQAINVGGGELIAQTWARYSRHEWSTWSDRIYQPEGKREHLGEVQVFSGTIRGDDRFSKVDSAWLSWRDRQDVLIVWCHHDYMILPRLMGWDGSLVFVSHGSGNWTKQYAEELAEYADALVAVSTNAVRPFPDAAKPRVRVILNGVDPQRLVTTRQANLAAVRRSLVHKSLNKSFTEQGREAFRRDLAEFDRVMLETPAAVERANVRRSIRDELGIKPNQIAVLHCGRFAGDKNPTAAAKAVSLIPDAVALYRCPEDQHFRAYQEIRPIVSLERCRFARSQSVADCYLAADVFVLASPSEGCSLSMLESLASGCPVVCTDVGGVPDIERLGGKVVKVPINPTAKQLAAAVREALARRRELTAAGLEFSARWNGAAMGQAWDELLDEFRALSGGSSCDEDQKAVMLI